MIILCGAVSRRRWYRKYPTWTRWGGTSLHGISKGYKKLQESGIILALVSKNNNDDVINVLEKHESMVLKRYRHLKINWNEKLKYSRTSKDLF